MHGVLVLKSGYWTDVFTNSTLDTLISLFFPDGLLILKKSATKISKRPSLAYPFCTVLDGDCLFLLFLLVSRG